MIGTSQMIGKRIIVTTPALAAQKVAARAASMAQKNYLRIAGVIENMSAFTCEHGTAYPLFGEGGGEKLANEYGVPFLGSVPMGIEVREGGDQGVPVVVGRPDAPQAQALRKVAEEVARQVSIEAMKPELVVLKKSQ